MNIKGLKVIQGIITVTGLVLSVAGTVIGSKVQKAENLEALAKLVEESKK